MQAERQGVTAATNCGVCAIHQAERCIAYNQHDPEIIMLSGGDAGRQRPLIAEIMSYRPDQFDAQVT